MFNYGLYINRRFGSNSREYGISSMYFLREHAEKEIRRECLERELRTCDGVGTAKELWSQAGEAIKLRSKKRTEYQCAAEIDTFSAKYLYYFSYKTTLAEKVNLYFFEFLLGYVFVFFQFHGGT